MDDAAVYRLDDETALVLTVDFFAPIVDDPFPYGEIAAANALSDVYAMGGRPISALNIAAFPTTLPKDVLAKILAGGASKAAEAGVPVLGGHTVRDTEPKYGMAVTGLVHPGRIVTNSTAQPGDALVLTKAIGTGVITTALKNGLARGDVVSQAVASMSALNRDASQAMIAVGVSAATDITGYGLLGHLRQMVRESGVSARVSRSAVPVLPGVFDLLEQGVAPGGTHDNFNAMEPYARWDPSLPETHKLLLCDAQTSGGLLISVPWAKLARLLDELDRRGVATRAEIGEIVDGEPGVIEVVA